ncbi:unnamed protein product, partial [Mesorhabditis belari]|uniref:L-Fucosyltransferase n=1 Tax=Mesorhabditis belari TaxID=2138241 RepID=A0AAF3EK98_9BILA
MNLPFEYSAKYLFLLLIIILLFLSENSSGAYKESIFKKAQIQKNHPKFIQELSKKILGEDNWLIQEKLLVGRMSSIHNGNQLGNRVFEILGLASIAKRLERKPAFLLQSDPFNEPVIHQLWATLMYFPNLLDGFFLESEPMHLDNYHYLDDLGWEDVVYRLGFSESTIDLSQYLLPITFREKDNRICVHLRRGDFKEFSAKFSFIVNALEFITKREKLSNYGITIFSDDSDYVKKTVETDEYSKFKGNTWLPRDGHPIHLVWSFISHQCTHILITNIQSTYGFLGAYLAGRNASIYFNPELHWRHPVPTPNWWIPVFL